jgi:predicted small secreted protein
MKKLIAMTAAFAFIGVLSGCNTMQGFGKDVEKTGDAIQKDANKAK